MDDLDIMRPPEALNRLRIDTNRLGFRMASEPRTGALLRALAASKPGGRLLELGTGTGVGTAWLLDGMDGTARLVSVDTDASAQEIARSHLGRDPRVSFHLGDGADFLASEQPQDSGAAAPDGFDLIYADAWPGKFTNLDQALSLLRLGGIYVVDDLTPQPNWPPDHFPRVPILIDELEKRSGFVSIKLGWSSGLMLLVRAEARATK